MTKFGRLAVVVCTTLAVVSGVTSSSLASADRDNPSSRNYGQYEAVLSVNGKVTTTTTIPLAAPSNALIYCDKAWTFADSNGTYHIQHACGGTTAPWGFSIQPALCAIATSTVTESGMAWTRNGVTQPRQAPHNVPCDYPFHGTYNPGRDYDKLTYSDVFKFEIPDGHATLTIHGSFTLLGSPCSPTSC